MATMDALRRPYPTEQVDPAFVAPDPGPMGRLYVDMREFYADGMTLACAEPQEPYQEVVAAYVRESSRPGFRPDEFWNDHFATPQPPNSLDIARPGITLDEYTELARSTFIDSTPPRPNEPRVWLPYPRSVAGAGRFRTNSYYWDGYHASKGHAADGNWGQVLDFVNNSEYQINRFGHVLNGDASFYATRSQPPYFSHAVRMLAEEYGPEALVRYLPAMEREYRFWMSGSEALSALPNDGHAHAHRNLVRMPDGSFLNRYWDDGDGPRLESYKEDCELGELVTQGLHGAIREFRLHKLFKDLRAGATSGWDFSSRWLADGQNLETINTTGILPVDLNSLVAYTEETLALAHKTAANQFPFGWRSDKHCEMAAYYQRQAAARKAAINAYMWDPNDRIYRDYNFVQGRQTSVVSAAMAYPLYVGFANTEQAFGVAEAVERDLLYPGGVIATTSEESTQQWDGGKDGKGQMNVWAPPNWATARGLARVAFWLDGCGANIQPLLKLAARVRDNYMSGVEAAYAAHGGVPEKHRGDKPERRAGGGEYKLVDTLNMSSETWRALRRWDVDNPEGCLPIGRMAVAAA